MLKEYKMTTTIKINKKFKFSEPTIHISNMNTSITVPAEVNDKGMITLTEDSLRYIFNVAFHGGEVSGKTEFSNTLNGLLEFATKE